MPAASICAAPVGDERRPRVGDDLGRGGHRVARRWRAASNSSSVPAIATLSDSRALHRDRHAVVERQVGGEAVRPRGRARTRSGRVRSSASGALAAARRRAPTRRTPAFAERLQGLHGGHTLHDPDRETRAGRGAHDLGIVRVDRSRPEDDYLARPRPPRCASACPRCRDRRAAARPARAIGAGERVETGAAASGATREHALRRDGGRAQRVGHARRELPHRDDVLGRARRRPPRGRRSRRRRRTPRSGTPWSSAAATTRGPSHDERRLLGRARVAVAQQRARSRV